MSVCPPPNPLVSLFVRPAFLFVHMFVSRSVVCRVYLPVTLSVMGVSLLHICLSACLFVHMSVYLIVFCLCVCVRVCVCLGYISIHRNFNLLPA